MTDNGATANDAPRSPLSLFRNRSFVALWCSGAAVSTVRWLELLATAVYAFEVTGSPLSPALLVALRMLPLALFGALAGSLAERVDRLTLQRCGLALMIALCAAQGALAALGLIQLWHVALGAFLNGVFWSTDMSARRTLLGDAVAPRLLGAAMSFDSLTGNGTRMIGPLLGGLLLATIGFAGTFCLAAALNALALAALSGLSAAPPDAARAPPGPLWRGVADGFRFARDSRALSGTLLITIVFNLWAFPLISMVPVIAKDALGLGPLAVGVLASMEGAGAFCGAIAIAFLTPPRYFRRVYLLGTTTFLLAALLFSQTSAPLPAALLLFCAGLGAAAFASMQATLTFVDTPEPLRRRVMGVLSVCIGVGPIGFLHLGLLAQWLGAAAALRLVSIEGLLALALVAWRWREVR